LDATCPRCGAAFDCGADRPAADPCWCAGIVLDEATRDRLAATFAGCVCPRCLPAATPASVELRPRPPEERR
jgi:hypothetical protein